MVSSLQQHHLPLPDTKQTVWQLVTIQLAGWTSLPVLATSILILQQNSYLGAFFTIIVGNAILWFIRLGMIAMAREGRQSTLDISRSYLGQVGGYSIAILLLISTLAWYVTQTTTASKALTQLISFRENPSIDPFTQVSVFLGMVSAFLCMNGIVLLKKLSMIAFPIVALSFLVILWNVGDLTTLENDHPMSLAGITLVLATNLGTTSDLPTFFRHSESWISSIKALTIVQIVSLVMGLLSLYFGAVINSHFEINSGIVSSDHEVFRISLLIFVFFSTVCANVANVYASSVGWELIAPQSLVGRKEYLILGLGLTLIFILVSNSLSMQFILDVSDISLVNLCVVLLIGYIISRRKGQSPDIYSQTCCFVAWLFSTGINIFQFSGFLFSSFSPLLIGLLIIVIVFVVSALVRTIVFRS